MMSPYLFDESPSFIRMRSPMRRRDWRAGTPLFSRPRRYVLSAPRNALQIIASNSSDENGPRSLSSRSARHARLRTASLQPKSPAHTTLPIAGSAQRRDQLLQNADIAGRDVLVEIVTCPIPLLRDLRRDVIEQEALTIEQLSASARTFVGSPSTGGSRISFLISRARRRFIRASFSARALSGMAAAWSVCASSSPAT
jgi:hypothetical protein